MSTPMNWRREFWVWLIGNVLWMLLVYGVSRAYLRLRGAPAKGAYILIGLAIASSVGSLIWWAMEPIGSERFDDLHIVGRLGAALYCAGMIWVLVASIVTSDDLPEAERIPEANELSVATRLGQVLLPLQMCLVLGSIVVVIALLLKFVPWLGQFV